MMSNLYKVRDEDYPLYVAAENIEAALEGWREWVANRMRSEGETPGDFDLEPNSVVMIAKDVDWVSGT